ncbi:MAG: rRNA ((1402)-2-O)-methyltransferase [Pseudomonadota bacterium]|jgi:16S rRNA (cytidine1402-2'-O)-methyltransferase
MAGGKTVHEVTPLAPGLYLVATPIGAARDITLRALDVLASADVLAAEDTRTLRHLMEIHGIALGNRPLVACHDHNEAQTSPRLVQAIAEGKSVAYASEAGTPMVSDPGFPLARAVIAAGQKVTAAPGPSAALCALMVAGLPTDRFVFAGFPPSQKSARRSFLQELAAIEATLVLYESPKRINQMLQDCCEILGDGRTMALCRELTKRFEEVIRGSLAEVRQAIADRDLKGEIVLVIGRGAAVAVDAATIGAALDRALDEMSVKDAAAAVAEAFDLPRREVYQMALQRTKP